MEKLIYTLFAGLLFMNILSCTTSHDEERIRQVVDSFLKTYNGDYRTVDRRLLSPELSALIDKAVTKEKTEEEKVAQSDSPTDKPLLIEGDVFSSLYEGYDHFNIDHITIDGNSATVTVGFTNSIYKEHWKDEVHLTRNDHWQIDDVIFKGHNAGMHHTKGLLQDFIH